MINCWSRACSPISVRDIRRFHRAISYRTMISFCKKVANFCASIHRRICLKQSKPSRCSIGIFRPITNFPVYLGRLDRMLQPFIRDEVEARFLIRHFMIFLDRTISDSYAHANIGPEATLAGQIILDCDYELQNATPSITLLYDPAITPDAFAGPLRKKRSCLRKAQLCKRCGLSQCISRRVWNCQLLQCASGRRWRVYARAAESQGGGGSGEPIQKTCSTAFCRRRFG